MDKYDEGVFIIFQVCELDDLPGLGEEHTAVVMVVFGAPVHDYAREELFQSNNVEVSRELLVAERSTRRTPVNAEERIFRGRKTVEAMDVG